MAGKVNTKDLNQSNPEHAEKAANGEVGLGLGVGQSLQSGGAGMAMGSSSAAGGDDADERHEDNHNGPSGMLSPSEPEDGDLDPAPSLIHRRELDNQERFDFEAEKRERMLSLGRSDLGVESIELEPGESSGSANLKAGKGLEEGEITFHASSSTAS